MKHFKHFLLATLTTCSLAFAGNDPVIEQINITQDAVNVALEEITKGSMQSNGSVDAEEKVKQFSSEAAIALKKFEENVRIRVLQSFSVLIGQYNNVLKNNSLGSAKGEILASLLKQITTVADDKSQIYKQAYLELYSILPDLPIQYDFTAKELVNSYDYSLGRSVVNAASLHNNKKCKMKGELFSSYEREVCSEYYYTQDLYLAKGQTKKLNLKSAKPYNPTTKNLYDLLVENGFSSTEDARKMILQGCYTSTCYFLMQSQYTIWKSMIESSLARDIEIKLNDGTSVKITRKVSRNGYVIPLLDYYLTNINTEGLINNLPYDTSNERFQILEKMNSQLSANKCSKAKSLKDNLCNETQEGCLKDSETALLKDRFGKNASCL